MKREIYDADHDSFRDSVRSFLDREVKPGWDSYVEAKQFPREMWLAFGRQGLLGLEVPEQWWCADMQNEVLDACVQLHGGYGYMNEYRVARAWRDARVSKIWAGSNELMKELIGRDLGL
ncbi:MAG: acyl-CoA dehydrogenase family protein [Pseudonocardia sediminis]